MTPPAGELGALWRVGYHADPLAYTPWELYQFNHRFDDIRRRFRTLYCAESPETCLREVLADFRPNLAALHRPNTADRVSDPPRLFQVEVARDTRPVSDYTVNQLFGGLSATLGRLRLSTATSRKPSTTTRSL